MPFVDNTFQSKLSQVVMTILNGQTASNAIDVRGSSLVGLVMPAAFTATDINLEGSLDNSAFKQLINKDLADLVLTFQADDYVLFVPTDFLGVQFFRLNAASSQGADRVFTAILRPM